MSQPDPVGRRRSVLGGLLIRLSAVSRRLPPSRWKIRAGRLVGVALTRLGASGVVEVEADDGVFLLDARSRTEGAKLWDGHHDEDDLALLRAATPTDGVFVDVGANVGLILVPLLHHLGPAGLAVGVEPVGVNFERLSASVVRNAPDCRVELREVALGAEPGRLTLVKEGSSASSGNAVPAATQPGAAADSFPVTTLDRLCAELALTRLDTIKIDVEGYEVEAFRGATDTLRRFRPVVYGEFHNQLMPQLGVTFVDAWALFEPLDYACFSFVDRLCLRRVVAPPADLGNVVLVPTERVGTLVARGVRVD